MVVVEVMVHGVGSNRAVRGPIGGGTNPESRKYIRKAMVK